MSSLKLYEHWLGLSFSSRFSTPFVLSKDVPTRPSATRRPSTWEVPLAKHSKIENGSEDAASATLCVQESRDALVFHEAELAQSETPLVYSGSEVYESSDEDIYNDELSQELGLDSSLDDDVLRHLSTSKDVLVLDSTTPRITPHIAITLASDTLADLTIAWFNRPNPQVAEKLCLPPPDFSENPPSAYSPPPLPPSIAHYSTPVFSPSKFNALIERCSDERLNHFNVVIALRRQVFKAVALEASQAAIAYRERYDTALPFADIERPFLWSDPAEPILLASRHYRATVIIDSPSPFRVPHIVINQSPPEDPWAIATNVINDPQDYGFGRYLVVHARGISYTNEPEDYCPDFGSGEVEDFDASGSHEDDYEAYQEPVSEQDGDYGESYCSAWDYDRSFEDTPELQLDTDSLHSLESPLPETPDTMDNEDFQTVFERALERRTISSSMPSSPLASCEPLYPSHNVEHSTCNPFDEIEMDDSGLMNSPSSWADDDDELPPIDDEWYQSVIRRTAAAVA
jgi:hypothetical protein